MVYNNLTKNKKTLGGGKMAFDVQATTEKLESKAGLALGGEIIGASHIFASADNNRSFGNVLVSIFGLLVTDRGS